SFDDRFKNDSAVTPCLSRFFRILRLDARKNDWWCNIIAHNEGSAATAVTLTRTIFGRRLSSTYFSPFTDHVVMSPFTFAFSYFLKQTRTVRFPVTFRVYGTLQNPLSPMSRAGLEPATPLLKRKAT